MISTLIFKKKEIQKKSEDATESKEEKNLNMVSKIE
jgi:hypothetical protein